MKVHLPRNQCTLQGSAGNCVREKNLDSTKYEFKHPVYVQYYNIQDEPTQGHGPVARKWKTAILKIKENYAVSTDDPIVSARILYRELSKFKLV
ncbi:hypothetical protein NQ317_001387 [Molorchus minor]|uniref:Uncharacterized protein n=1 Tax=Molorchus minor TaxID=1323400 RepID=A0ABQ9IQY6_9CUCU|nr:hypothetical protein NQ317_001387 [Molorchus minor]